jgi:hypothetical protein
MNLLMRIFILYMIDNQEKSMVRWFLDSAKVSWTAPDRNRHLFGQAMLMFEHLFDNRITRAYKTRNSFFYCSVSELIDQ